MNIDELTIGEAKELASLFNVQQNNDVASEFIDEFVIVRTYSAGVWFGKLAKKSNNEVILSQARRMWLWKAKESISLSAVSIHGIDTGESKVVEPVDYIWLEAIEIIPCTKEARISISGAPHVKQT